MTDESKCPACEEIGETSRVYVPQYSTTTTALGQSFYDENGRFHNHDRNINTAEWSCSKGHRWVVRKSTSCPAGDQPGTYEVTFK